MEWIENIGIIIAYWLIGLFYTITVTWVCVGNMWLGVSIVVYVDKLIYHREAEAHKQDMLNNKTTLNVEPKVVMQIAEYGKTLQRYLKDGALLMSFGSNGMNVWINNTKDGYGFNSLRLNVSLEHGVRIISEKDYVLYAFNADGTTTAFGSEKARKKESNFSFKYILSEIIYNWKTYQSNFQKKIEERVPQEMLTSFNIKSLEVSA